MKCLSSDTTLEAQRFLIERLRAMPLAKKYAITAGTIRAGFALHRSEVKDMNPFEVARHVSEFLEKEDIEYFVGGSLASTTYGEPRFTQGIDLIVRLSEDKIETLVECFQNDFYVSAEALTEAVKEKSSANLIHLETNFKIDLIISRDRPFEQSRFERKTRKEATGIPFWFCTAEDIVLVKLEWYKASSGVLDRQLRDVQTVLMVQEALDLAYLRKWAQVLDLSEILNRTLEDAGVEG